MGTTLSNVDYGLIGMVSMTSQKNISRVPFTNCNGTTPKMGSGRHKSTKLGTKAKYAHLEAEAKAAPQIQSYDQFVERVPQNIARQVPQQVVDGLSDNDRQWAQDLSSE